MDTIKEAKGKLIAAIRDACTARSILGEEFNADDILNDVMVDDECWRERAENLVRSSVRRLITQELKSSSGLELDESYPQLALDGFEHMPRNIPFRDGKEILFIATLAAEEKHIKSAIELRRQNIAFCSSRLGELQLALDLVQTTGAETFGEALLAVR